MPVCVRHSKSKYPLLLLSLMYTIPTTYQLLYNTLCILLVLFFHCLQIESATFFLSRLVCSDSVCLSVGHIRTCRMIVVRDQLFNLKNSLCPITFDVHDCLTSCSMRPAKQCHQTKWEERGWGWGGDGYFDFNPPRLISLRMAHETSAEQQSQFGGYSFRDICQGQETENMFIFWCGRVPLSMICWILVE